MAQPEPSGTMENQAATFTWTIENFSRLKPKKLYSDVFVVAGHKWRVMVFPNGNNVDHLSMYLDVADSTSLPPGWSRYAQISFTVLNQMHSKYSIRKDTEHQFNARESDWGFTSFIPLGDLYNPTIGYIMNDTVVIEAAVDARKVDEKDIAEDFRIRLKREQEEKDDKKKYKAQAHLFTMIKVARDEDLKEQIGRDIYFDLVDHDKVRNFRIQKQTPFAAFKEEVARDFGIPVHFLRFWIWAKRENHTYRPHRPLTAQEQAQTVGQLRKASNDLKLFLEVEFGPDLRPIAPPYRTKKDILLFFKFYDPEKGELRYVGRFFVKSSSKPIEILGKLNQIAGFAPGEEIELYEEIKFEPYVMCEHLDKRRSFSLSQIEDGDIICFQKSPPQECEENHRHPDVPSFLKYVHNRQGAPVNSFVSLSATSLLENLTNVLTGIPCTKQTKISTSSCELSESGLPSNPLSLQQHKEALKNYLALSLEDIERANAFDQIERITVLILQHSTSSLERAILKDLVSRLVAFKEIIRVGKSSIEHMRAQLTKLTEKKAAVGARFDQAVELGGSFKIKLSKLSEEETELDKQIMYLTKQKERLLACKNSVALEVQKFTDELSDDVAEWQDISKEVETANLKCLQEREKLAQANLSWKLFEQNLEQFVKKAEIK